MAARPADIFVDDGKVLWCRRRDPFNDNVALRDKEGGQFLTPDSVPIVRFDQFGRAAAVNTTSGTVSVLF